MATLLVCLDGTNQIKIQPNPTNVAKIFDAFGGAAKDVGNGSWETVLPMGAGYGKYLPGVGTQGNAVLKVLGATFGDGIAEPIVRGYTFLSRNYKSGDDIFIVGFSRGATAARALAGLVVTKGLLNTTNYQPDDKDAAYARAIAAWYQYREPRPELAQQARLELISGTIGRVVPKLTPTDFTPPPQIQAVGVFDTVSSLGVPELNFGGVATYDFSICDTALNPAVLNGFHALAADEMRNLFVPTLWAERDKVIQEIFPGCHANVGGGYPENGLSDGALVWMLTRLAEAGLASDTAQISATIAPNPIDIARDEAAVFPFNATPRSPRMFPKCARVSSFLRDRLDKNTEVLPHPVAQPYRPIGKYADGSLIA